jgi:hypothetical protein
MNARSIGNTVRRAPWGVLGALLLVVGVERTIARHAADFETEWAADRVETAKLAVTEAPRSRILVFGDSTLKFGVLPSLLERSLGLSACTLAMHGGHPAENEVLLRRALHAGARPEALVIGFQPFLLDDDVHTRLRPFAELMTPAEIGALGGRLRDPGLAAALWARQTLPSLKDRKEIRDAVVASLQGLEVGRRTTLAIRRRNWERNRGAQVIPAQRFFRFFKEFLREDRATWTCDSVAAAHTDRFLALAEQRHIPVFLVLPPVHPDVQANLDHTGDDARLTAWAQALGRRHANVVLVDVRHAGYPEPALIDPVHVNRRGAGALTDGLASVIRSELQRPGVGPREVSLTFRPSAGDDGAEDLAGSAVAVGNPKAPLY